MLNISDRPCPATATALRAPQARLNTRTLRSERTRHFIITFVALAIVAAVTVGAAAFIEKVAANTCATVEQARAMGAM